MTLSEPAPSRPCQQCDQPIADDHIIDTWGDDPNPLQVLAYECPDCGHVTGYFRELMDAEYPGVGVEFKCRDRQEYARLYGDDNAFRELSANTVVKFPSSVHGRLVEAEVTQTESLGITNSEDGADVIVDRGATVAVPDADFQTFYATFFAEEEPEGDWFIVGNVRFVRQGSDAADHHR